jgi:hypothetical protein
VKQLLTAIPGNKLVAHVARVSAIIATAVLLLTAPRDASAQVGYSRQLTLVGPGDPNFDALLNANYPGLEDLDSFKAIRPYLAILENETSHAAKAFAIEYDFQSDGAVPSRVMNVHFIQEHFEAGEDRWALGPGEIRLIAPNLHLAPVEYPSRRNVLNGLFAGLLSSPHLTASAVVVDAVIYDDGAYTGLDHYNLLQKYKAVRDAEHDESVAVTQLITSGATDDAIVAALNGDVQAATVVNTSRPDENGGLYAMEYTLDRGHEAQKLLSLYRRVGSVGLKARAIQESKFPHETITPLSQ